MAPHSTPTDKRAIADSLFAVKEQLPDGHYLALMNMLGGKHEVPDITNAKLVEIRWDHFCVPPINPMGDEDAEGVDYFPHGRIFRVLDEDRLAAFVARDSERAKRSVADSCSCEHHPLSMMHPLVTSITTGLLRHIHGNLTSDTYGRYSDGVIRVRDLEVLATYD